MCRFFFKQKTAYECRISDWSSDVCSSDLDRVPLRRPLDRAHADEHAGRPTDALEGGERETLELSVLAGLRDEHPGLGFLGDGADLVRERALGAEVGQLGELDVAQPRAVLGLDLDRHASGAPVLPALWSLQSDRKSTRLNSSH